MSDDFITYLTTKLRGARLKIRAEGAWDDVMRIIGQAHFMLHKKGIVRIQTDIRVGSRYDNPKKVLESYESSKITGRIRSRSSARK